MTSLIFLWLAGCRTDGPAVTETDSVPEASAQDSAPAAEPEAPSSYVLDEEEEEPGLEVYALANYIDRALDLVLTGDPAYLHDVYEQLRRTDDEGCPSYDEEELEDNNTYEWQDSCQSSSGTVFQGEMESYYYTNYYESSGTYYTHNSYLSGSARLISASGEILDLSGRSRFYQRTNSNGTTETFYNDLKGNFRWSGDSEGSWLGEELSFDLDISATRDVDGQGAALSIHGSVSGFQGEISAVYMDSVKYWNADYGGSCSREPSGMISLRDANGEWYDAYFDAPNEQNGEIFPPDCDGCGHVYFRGVYQGTVCPEFHRLEGWVRPW